MKLKNILETLIFSYIQQSLSIFYNMYISTLNLSIYVYFRKRYIYGLTYPPTILDLGHSSPHK